MGKIVLLDDSLSNKINAGEVVERPASVVKELVENAIDANSTNIEVEIEEAGLSKIRIIDNGDGIEEDDVLRAFARHATSKIKDENDLFRIKTLGFRGEALPSIASVSKVELITSTGAGAGTRLVLEGGKQITFEPAPSRKGTDFTVSNLFFNTPARLKYLKTIHTELGNITDVMNRLALAHPEIAMKLIHNGRTLLHTTGNGDARQVLSAIYGFNIVKKMIPIHATSLDFQLDGYLALPELTRASRNYISTMVNGRFIKNYGIANAVIAGYHTLLPIGRFPLVFLNITMDPILIDVNVHPTKMEVRLSKEQDLFILITETIKNAFRKQTLIPVGNTPKIEKEKSEQIKLNLDHLPGNASQRVERSPLSKIEREVVRDFLPSIQTDWENYRSEAKDNLSNNVPVVDEAIKDTVDPNIPSSIPKKQDTVAIIHEERSDLLDSSNPLDEAITYFEQLEENSDWEANTNASESDRIPPLYPIGQMHGTYILAQNENGLYIIDQHAAQERIKYEFFRDKIGEVSNELQELLLPMTLQFSNDEYIKLEQHLEELEKVGVFLEPFGGNSFIVRSHPHWFPRGEEQETIQEIIEQVLSMKNVDLKKLREATAIMMSCKGSIKANHHLRNDEIQQLLDTLRLTTDPFTCPHGRPIIIHFSTYEMEKMFKRVM
ncbi:DNA mismatch repair endonuclease MutL [Caldibacillus lycopersici]|uniref:DNA mismatch repair protein MutL n=1 Tax=Perspicuibacillus lycopersici TaxID=1325689 RepID=A0AAE3IP32_9BACI|nr:DNA mismatch repair endonuclease MutL [Perspicuibacillus lycopersici]MCU9611978.1 DNA mismatch repair endonuclease MutL [Perspicuibacillus lycopersici]